MQEEIRLTHQRSEAETLLIASDIHQQVFHVVFTTLPSKGMSRASFANKEGPRPLRNKRYPYGFPWLSKFSRRQVDKTTIEAATLLMCAFATMTQGNTGLVLFAPEERGEAHYAESHARGGSLQRFVNWNS